MKNLLRHGVSALLAAGFLALGATDAYATHFRYGTLRWEKTAEDANNVTILVTTESAWRFDYPGWPATPTVGVSLDLGINLVVQRMNVPLTVLHSTPLAVRVSAVNSGLENWFVGASQYTFTFAKANLPVRIFFTDSVAQRISTLQDGNANRFFRVESIMTATPNAASPSASILPIITVAHGLPEAHFFIPAADVEGDTLTWSIAPPLPAQRSLLFKAAPDGFPDGPTPTLTINPATGEVTWKTITERTPGVGTEFYAVQFIVTDSKGAETPVDALLRLVPNVGTAPDALIQGSTGPYLVSVRPNNPVSFTVRGIDVDAGATVTLTSGNMPPGSSMTPSLPMSGTGAPPNGTSSVFNWTPTLAQEGNVFVVPFAVTDNVGQQDTNSAQITVLLNSAPTVTCPDDLFVEATGVSGATATLNASVSDPDSDALTVRWFVDGVLVDTQSPPPAPPVPPTPVSLTRLFGFLPAPHEIRVEVSDGLATQDCTSELTVQDTTDPVLTLPANITEEAVAAAGNVVTFVATAVDNIDGPIPVDCAPPSGSLFLITTTTVNCSATDSHGNTAEGSFTVTVQDTTPPDLDLPENMTVPATGPTGAVVTFEATAFDIVAGNVPVTCVPASGDLFPVGTTTVNCSARDTFNNVANGFFLVTVVDLAPPIVTVRLNPGVLWPPNHKMVNIQVTVTVVDTDPNPFCRITQVTSNEPVNGPGDGNRVPDWIFSGLNLQLRAERSGHAPHGSVGRIYTVTVACTDRDGNTGFGTATAIVPHDMRGRR